MRAKFPDAILKNAGMVSVHRRWSNESGKRQENRKMVDSVSLYGLAGETLKSTKRGFATKREAEEWLRNFLITQKADFDMKFEDFWKMYYADMETRLREHTMRTKKYIVELKILPYFGNKRVNDITAADIRQWQNELIKMGYSPTYLKTINNQLSTIFNYAIRYYDLKSNYKMSRPNVQKILYKNVQLVCLS